MSVQNLATVFGPNILRPQIEDPVTIMEGNGDVCSMPGATGVWPDPGLVPVIRTITPGQLEGWLYSLGASQQAPPTLLPPWGLAIKTKNLCPMDGNSRSSVQLE